jgi:hypothetical protein
VSCLSVPQILGKILAWKINKDVFRMRAFIPSDISDSGIEEFVLTFWGGQKSIVEASLSA